MRVVFLTIKGLRFKRFDKTEERTKPIHHQKFVTLWDFLCINSTFDIMNYVYINLSSADCLQKCGSTINWMWNMLQRKGNFSNEICESSCFVILPKNCIMRIFIAHTHTLLNSKVNRNNSGGKIRFLFLFFKTGHKCMNAMKKKSVIWSNICFQWTPNLWVCKLHIQRYEYFLICNLS